MAKLETAVGFIGSGALGGAMARRLLRSRTLPEARLWLCSRSESRRGFEDWPGVHVTVRPEEVAENCGTLVLALPPAAVTGLSLAAAGHLVISVMAGVTLAQLGALTGSARLVRAMSNPAAEIGLAYSPWVTPGLDGDDRATVDALFSALGTHDEVPDEALIDEFTALTGPVPGFVAYYAQCMVEHAVETGVPQAIAERAIRQLFHAGGILLAQSDETPADHVEAMIAYAGTTAAGLEAMKAGPLKTAIAAGLQAAADRARAIGK